MFWAMLSVGGKGDGWVRRTDEQLELEWPADRGAGTNIVKAHHIHIFCLFFSFQTSTIITQVMFKSFVTAVSLFSFIGAVVAQDNTAVDIEAIQAHFSQAGIVPSLLTTFDPSALLTVSFDGVGDISPGQPLTQDRPSIFIRFFLIFLANHLSSEVQPTPSLTVTPANSSVTLPTGNYTVVMVDAGPVGTDESQGQTRHWLANGITLSGKTYFNLVVLALRFSFSFRLPS